MITIIEAIPPYVRGQIERVSFGYRVGVADPPVVAEALQKAKEWRVMPWADALPVLEKLGREDAANIVLHTSRCAATLEHNGRGWSARISWP